MLARIRTLIYKAGFRPSRSSIFYSPSLASVTIMSDAMKHMGNGLEMGLRRRLRQKKEATTRVTLFQRMNFCVMCGAKLEPFVLDTKECPNFHGRAFTTEDSYGLPVITFEPTE